MENAVELAKNYTIYFPDLPGFGQSESIAGDCYIPELVEFIDEFAHKLGLESFYLMGHSLGGGVALSYVLKFPHRIKKLVLINSMCLGKEIAFWVRFLSVPAICRSLGSAILALFRGLRWLARRLYSSAEVTSPFSQTSINFGSKMTTLQEQSTVLVNRLSEIMVPTLLVWGGKDPIVPVKQAYAAAQLIGTCQLEVFQDCGHSVHREKIPEFSKLLRGFLG